MSAARRAAHGYFVKPVDTRALLDTVATLGSLVTA